MAIAARNLLPIRSKSHAIYYVRISARRPQAELEEMFRSAFPHHSIEWGKAEAAGQGKT